MAVKITVCDEDDTKSEQKATRTDNQEELFEVPPPPKREVKTKLAPPDPLPEVTSEIVLVTPKMADEWLEMGSEIGKGQRFLRPRAVDKMVRDMVNGEWYEDLGDPIRFDWHGFLRDGQHRLNAVILAQRPCRFTVMRGLDPASIKAVDTGTPRRFMDVLIMDGDVNVRNLSAVTRRAYLWDKGRKIQVGGGIEIPTHAELMDYLDANPELRMACHRGLDIYRHGYKLLRPSVGGFAYFLTARLDYDAAEDFWSKFMTHENISMEHPAMVLSRRLNSASKMKSRLNAAEHLSLVIRAWNYYCNDETAERLQVTRGGLTETNFPVPKAPRQPKPEPSP